MFELDAYTPKQIADRVETIGVSKARMPLLATFSLAVIAGGFIGLGALYFNVVASDAQLPFALSRVLGGVAFSLGLILVIVAGAELFTGNNLLVMAWAGGKIGLGELVRNWVIVFAGNAVGAIGLAVIVWLSHHGAMNGNAVAVQYVKIAAAKVHLPFWDAFFKGVLCNLLVCLAVWLSLAGHTVADKILAIVFPISAFVAAGFEHSIANMYFIPIGMLLSDAVPAGAVAGADALNLAGFAANLVPVTLGNIAGGSVLVALIYFLIYRVALREPA